MTEYEMRKIAKMQAEYLAEALKNDEELLDLMFPQKPMDVKAAAAFLNMSVSRLLHIVSEVPHEKVGKKLYFTERGLTRWIRRTGRQVTARVVGLELAAEEKRRKVT